MRAAIDDTGHVAGKLQRATLDVRGEGRATRVGNGGDGLNVVAGFGETTVQADQAAARDDAAYEGINVRLRQVAENLVRGAELVRLATSMS